MNKRTNLYALLAILMVITACSHSSDKGPDISDYLPEQSSPYIEPASQQPTQETVREEPPLATPVNQPPCYDFEFTNDDQVDYWIERYTGQGKRYFRNTLYKFDQVRPIMEDIFAQHGLPKDLVYLALIESGGYSNAVSHAGATGCWQFMPGTARRYGLDVNRWIDERRDLEKSTHAAASYLSHLYSIFDDWLLACAAYNAGEGTIKRIQRRHPDVDSFWDISRKMPIKRETLAYVPKFLAAMIIGNNREAYDMQVPGGGIYPTHDIVEINTFTYLDEVAEITGYPLSRITKLNPELIRGCTPPSAKNYELKVPEGSAPKVENYLKRIHDPHVEYITYKIQAGDSLYKLANRNNTTVDRIAEVSRIDKQAYLQIGQVVIIPVNSEYDRPRRKHTHIVAKGESLKMIAGKHGIEVSDLVAVNHIANPNLIQPETELIIPPKRILVANARHIRYEVKKGDTIWDISRKFSVSSKDILRWNQLSASASIYPGDELTIYR